MDRPSPYLLHEWLSAWARHYVAPGALRIVTARDDGVLVGVFPLFLQRRWGLNVAGFPGGNEAALSDLIVRAEDRDTVGRGLIAAAARGDHDYVDLFGFPLDGSLSELHDARELEVLERVVAPVLDLAPGFDTVYMSHTTSKRRNSDRRRERQLHAEGRVDVTVARTADDLRAALESAFDLHRLRWAGRPDGSDFASARGAAFQRAAIAALAPLGVPRIVTVSLDDRPIAFHYSFLLEERLYVHRLAFDPTQSRFGPGWLCMLEALKAGDADGAKLVEYLGGDESYKLEFADRVEPLGQAVGLATSLRGRAAAAVRIRAIRARLRLKHSPTARRLHERLSAVGRRVGPSDST